MKNKENSQKELEDLSPFLANLEKKEGFSVPKNYFKTLPDEILSQVQPQIETAPKTSWFDNLLLLFSPRLAIGLATIALLMIGTVVTLNKEVSQSPVAALDQLTNEAISIYIAANIEDFDDETIYGIDGLETLDVLPDDIEDAALDQYLEEYIDDIAIETLEDLL